MGSVILLRKLCLAIFLGLLCTYNSFGQGNVIFQEYFNGSSVSGSDGYAWSSASPPGYGGVNPNPLGMKQENISCNSPYDLRYQIARSARYGPNGTSWAPPSVNGCPFDNVRAAQTGGNMFLMGALYDNGNNAPAGFGGKRFVWQTRQKLYAGHSYQFSALIGDLATDAGGGYGGSGGGILDMYESRFGVKVWCVGPDGSAKVIAQSARIIGNYGDAVQSTAFGVDQGTDDYVLGIEIVSAYTNCSTPTGNYNNTPCTTYPFAAAINYFGIAQIVLRNTLPTPKPAQRIVERCWGDPATFNIVSSTDGTSGNPLSGGAQYEWYTKASDGTRQNVVTTTNPDFPLTMPTTATSAVPNAYYVDIVSADGVDHSEEVYLNAIWYNIDAAIKIDAGFSGTAPYLKGYQMQFAASPGNDQYIWNWGDGQTTTTNGNTAIHAFAQAGIYSVGISITKNYKNVPGGSCTVAGILGGVVIISPLCEVQVLNNGQFYRNNRSGAISYVSPTNTCLPVTSFECLSDSSIVVPRVVAASATAFTDQLPATTANPAAAANPYLAGQWRTTPQASYSFRTSLTPDPLNNPLNYSFGTFALRPFDWESSLRNRPASWLTAAVTEQISGNGDVLQERDPLGIPSTAKFGYGLTLNGASAQLLPYLQAHNAEYQSVLFESFENIYNLGIRTGEDGLALPSDVQVVTCDSKTASCYAHTGNACAQLTNRQLQLLPISLTNQLNSSGILVKIWVRLQDYVPAQLTASVDLIRSSTGTVISTPLTTSIQTGEWLLFEARVPMNTSGAVLGESLLPRLRFSNDGASNIWVDDIRVQPTEAQMTTYVYDPVTLRLIASFDDQHFALRYQYNTEGKLIRKQAETERGLKTLQETHYHTPATDLVND